MTELEDRLRQELRQTAERLAPAVRRPLREPARSRPLGRPRGRLTVPIAAAAAVAMIAAAMAVLLPRALAGHHHQGSPSGVAAGASVPKFFVAVAYSRVSDATRLEVVASATGRVVDRFAAPQAGRSFQAVAPLGNNRTFVAEASGRRCDTWFYQFRLSPQGQLKSFVPLAVPEVPGQVVEPGEPDPAPLATSANGNVIAFSTQRCGSNGGSRTYLGQVGTIDLATRTVTTWKFRWPASPWSLSLSADGSLLEFVSNPSNGQYLGSDAFNAAWTLRTDSAGGWLAQHYRRVIGPSVAPTAAALSPNGRVMFAVVPVQGKRPGQRHDVLRAYQTASGRLLHQILTFPVIRQGPSISADASGRYLLAFFLGDKVKWVDLATGRLEIIRNYPAFLLDAAW